MLNWLINSRSVLLRWHTKANKDLLCDEVEVQMTALSTLDLQMIRGSMSPPTFSPMPNSGGWWKLRVRNAEYRYNKLI